MAASTKDHLGARVSKGKRQVYVDAAAAAGLTLNVWVERTLDAALARSEGEVPSGTSRDRLSRGRTESRTEGAPTVPVPASHRAPVEGVGFCPKATCSAAGMIGNPCPLHPNLRFKVGV